MTVGRIPNIEGGIQPTLLTTTGDIIYASSANNPARLGIGSSAQVLTVASGVPSWATPASASPASANSYVSTLQSTSSTSYVGLTTAQTVTLTTGTKVLVLIGCTSDNDYSDGIGARMSYAISGATTLASSDDFSVGEDKHYINNQFISMTRHSFQTVTAGSNTFTAQFRRVGGAGSARFSARYLTVIDLGS